MNFRQKLTEAEWNIAKLVGEMRCAENKGSNVKEDKLHKTQSTVEIDIDGMAGEIAVAKYLNLYPDFCTRLRHVKNDKGDLVTQRGTWLDVKSSRYHNCNLILDVNAVARADYYVLCLIIPPDVIIRGAIECNNALNAKYVKKMERGNAFFVPHSDLKSFYPTKDYDIDL